MPLDDRMRPDSKPPEPDGPAWRNGRRGCRPAGRPIRPAGRWAGGKPSGRPRPRPAARRSDPAVEASGPTAEVVNRSGQTTTLVKRSGQTTTVVKHSGQAPKWSNHRSERSGRGVKPPGAADEVVDAGRVGGVLHDGGTHAHAHARTHARARARTHARTRTHARARARTRTHAHARTSKHACTRTIGLTPSCARARAQRRPSARAPRPSLPRARPSARGRIDGRAGDAHRCPPSAPLSALGLASTHHYLSFCRSVYLNWQCACLYARARVLPPPGSVPAP
jgi:hypothetical protein